MERALPGALVEIQDARGARVARVETSSDGTFFVELASGGYAVVARYPGFVDRPRPVDVSGETRLEIPLALSPLSEDVSVTATRNEARSDRAPQPVSVVASDEIDLRQPANVTELLATLPGVHFTESGPFRPRPVLRGLDSNRLLVLVDGQRLNNARTSTSNSGIEPGLVDVGQIERVEVVRGAGSVLHGSDAMAGVINIITRKPERSADPTAFGSLTTTYHGVADGARVHGTSGWTSARWALRAGGSFGDFHDYESAGGIVPNSGARERNLDATLSVFPTSRDLLRFQWTTRHGRDIGVPGTTLDEGFFATIPAEGRGLRLAIGWEF